MTGNIVARRYAKALFAVGVKNNELDAYGKELGEVAEVLKGSPEALKLFRTPLFSAAEKKAVFDKIAGELKLSKSVQNFCSLLADKGRLSILPDIYLCFRDLLDVEQGILRGELVTAIDLPGGRKSELKERLEKQTGRKLVLDYASDKDILGGVVLKIGDRVLDASLRAQLQILKDNIKRGD